MMSQHRSGSGGAKDLVITCIKGEGKFLKFWALPITGLETVKGFESRLGILKQELDSSPGFSRSEQIPLGFKCVVKSKIKQFRWCRAGVLGHQSFNTILVRLLDYGNDEVILASDVRNIDDPIMNIQSQAIECILADVMPIHNEWTVEAIKFCEQHLLYNTLSCYVVSEYMKLPVVRVAKKGEAEAFVQRLINGGMALIKRETVSPPPATLSYKINTMDLNSNHLVKVSCFENAHKFYVQLSAAEMELKRLMDSINSVPKDNYGPLKVPAVNTPCLAKLSTKDSYYRALITFVQQNQCKVFFVDYGFSEHKGIHELRAIPSAFLNLAAQAICCSFPREANIGPEEFKRLVGHEHIELHVLSRTSELYIVKFLFQGHDLLMSSQTAQNYIAQKLNIGAKCEVTVSYVCDLSEFYCQLTPWKDQQKMISDILNTGYNSASIFLNECIPGKPVCAKFSEDNLWYRARIIKVNHEHDIEVFFVDFGNCDNVNLSDIKKIGSDLLKFPIQAFKCFLHETPLPTDSKARDDAFDLLEELTTDANLHAVINTFAGDAGYGITLYMRNSQLSVNEKILSKFMSIPIVPVNDIEDVYVTSFDSCASFFAQFEKLDSDKLTEMQDEINKFYSGTHNNSFLPKEGKLVCARFYEDDQFYRGKIENCKDGHCDIYFIDYGNRESIPVSDVYALDPKFTQYPQFGVECAFDTFPSQIPNDKIAEVMLENSFKLKMIRKDGDKWYVSLVENDPGSSSVLKLIREFEVSNVSSKYGEKFSGHQEKHYGSQAARSDSWNDNTKKVSHLSNRSETISNYDHKLPKTESFTNSEPDQEFRDYSLISIPPKACRNIYISHIVNPGEFYCQIEEDSSKLQLLMKNVEDTYMSENDNNLKLLNFVVDAPCCAMYEDGAWYRGKIKKVGTGTCDIFFVDYGNTNLVPKSKIKKLKNDLFRWPAQAICCKAFNISPKFKDWNDDEINAFINQALDKSFIAQFVECDNNNCYAINLFSIGKLESTIFNKEFVNLGYGRLQDTNKSIILNPHAASTNLSFSTPDIQIGSLEPVQVFYGLNPGEIYCQLKSYEQEFKQMMIKMQNYYKNVTEAESLIDRPHQGMICAAQFSLDSAWYRAEIKKIETNKIIVFYVDYGNSETVDRKKIRCIIQEYTILPVQAIKCRIRGIKPPGKSWTINNNLGKYYEGDCVCKFISKENDSYLVEITCNKRDVAQSLISDGLAVSDGSTSVQNKHEYPKKIQSEVLKLHDLPEESRIMQHIPERKDGFTRGQLLSVTISFIENPIKFWCQLLDESDILNELVEKIENEAEEYPSISPSSLRVGSFCMAQYSEDEAWYRVQIKSCESEGTYKVFFIDYGNSELVSLPQMKTMVPDLTKQPPFCFECCLYNAPSKLLPEMTTLFSDTVTDVEEITAKIEGVHSGICSVTLLFDKDDQEMNVNELLFGVKDEIIESGDTCKESPRFLPPDVPLGLHEGFISVVKSPQDFFIQLAGTEDPLADLSEELAELSGSSADVNPVNLCLGYACSTKYSEDNNWYRAEIIEIHDSTVSVLFVDYGNIETVEKNTLKCLSDKHLLMPSQAIKCKLNGIVPVADEWTEEAINSFQDMVLESPLGITFISKDIPATVNITKDDKEIAQCLVDMELANFESCTEADEAYAEDHLAPPPVEDPLSSLPNDQSYPQRKLNTLKHMVKICYVDSYDKFYITPLELGTELDTVSATLEILYESENAETEGSKSPATDVLEDPKIAMPCVAKYNEDNKWYRAIITEIDEENIYVKFIDFGNSEISNVANLRPLPIELLKIPPIALECSLFGIIAVPGKEQEISTKLEEYYLDEVELEVEIIEFSPYKVKLFFNGEDVASSLVKEGLAEEQCTLPDESGTFVDSSKMTFVDESLEYKIQISKRFFSGADKIIGNVKFCEIENDLIVFHVVSTDLEDDLQDLQQKLQNAYCEPSRNLANVSCMDFCATKYMEDENWYRAQILSIEKEKIKVRFIDYGNCETVDKSDIYELLGDFTIEPQFSVKCILFGLKVDKSKEVELQNTLDEYVYHEPVELKLCKHSHAVCDLCIASAVCGNTDITELISVEKLVYPQYVINCQLDAVFKAIVKKIEADIVFLLPLNVIDEREAFQCKLQNLCKDLEKLKEIKIDHLCAAKVDNVWYRVSVLNISDNEVTVDLVDFGFIKMASISEFVPLPLDICHQPVFLQPCVVHVTEDPSGNAKTISIEDLSLGCEISCEVQKIHLIQPLSIRIIEIYSNLEKTETENENKVGDVNESVINDSESLTNDIKISETESAVDSEKDNFIQNESNEFLNVDIQNNTAITDPTSVTDNIKISEDKTYLNSEKEICISDNIEVNIENDTSFTETSETITDSKPFIDDIKISDDENYLDSENKIHTLNNELTVENDKSLKETSETITDSEYFTEDVKVSEIETFIDSEMEICISDEDKDNIENNATVNDSKLFTDDIETSRIGTCIDSGKEVYISDNDDELDEVYIENDPVMNNTESYSNNLEISESEAVRNFENERCFSENEEFDKAIVENIPVNDSKFFSGDIKESEIEGKVCSTVECFSDNFEENELSELQSGKIGEKICKEISLKDETLKISPHSSEDNVQLFAESNDALCEAVTDNSIVEIDKNNFHKSEFAALSAVDKENLEEGENNHSFEKYNVVETNNMSPEKNSVDLIKQHTELETFDVSEDMESNENFFNSSKNIDEHLIGTSLSKDKYELGDETQINLSELDDNRSSDYPENDANSFEGTTQKENNRVIEDSYQLTGLVPVKVSHIAISDGSVIFAVQPLYLLEEFLLLKKSIQDFYSSKAIPYDASSNSNYCVVYHEGEWCRGKILQSGDSTILLIDYGKCTSVDNSDIKKLDNEHSSVPPFAVWCTLSSAICTPEKIETTKTFLCDKLKDTDPIVKILEGGEPYKINMFINGESVLNLLLKNSLVIQKLPKMYFESGSHKAKLSFLNIVGTIEIFVNLSSFSDDFNTLFEDMQNKYSVDDFVSNIVESGIYATFYNDSWYRGLVVSSRKDIQVYLVDTGESVIDCKNLCFLLPEHCLQPAFAIPCHIPFSDFQATNEIFESVNGILKAAEFLVDLKSCPSTNSLSATLIDEQIMSEVKNIALTYVPSESVGVKMEDIVNTDIPIINDIVEVSCTDSNPVVSELQNQDNFHSVNTHSPSTDSSISNVQNQEISEQVVGYLEETFTAEP